MKTTKILFISIAFVLASCINKKNQFDASGVFEATEVIVSAKGNGEIIKLDLQEGQIVNADTPLGYIDTTQLYLKKAQLMAGLKALGSRHTNVANQVSALKKQIETLKREKKRFENLLKSNAGTQKQVDDISSQLEIAQRQLAAQTEQLNNANSSISGESEGIEIQIAQINDQIKNSIIKSPINGTVLSKYAEQGELASQGRVLFKIANLQDINLRVYITSSQLTSVKLGLEVKVFADEGITGRKEYSGTIIWISDKAEFTPKTIQTRDERANLVYAVKVAVKNDGYIRKGMYGEIKF
jgi:HlyD family secretion protein